MEIGSFLGESARVMAESSPGLVYCIDHWDESKLPQHPDYEFLRAEKRFYARFLENVGDLVAKGKILPIKDSSPQAAMRFPDSFFDMIFIDAMHDYDSVCADIIAWTQKLAPGGLLCGHDYEPNRGVPQAVQELVPGFKLAGRIWYA